MFSVDARPLRLSSVDGVAMNSPRLKSKASYRPLRILCAEDNVSIGELMVLVFRKAGHVAEHATDGLAAWHRLSQDFAQFDVIVTDHQMPGLDGLMLVERLRQSAYRGRIIVQSANLTPRQAERYRALGVSTIAGKNLKPDELLRLLDPSLAAQTPACPR